ncbi:MAG: ATP-binding cassette domain-containing protein [Pseudomonadota bacterium]
MTFKALGLTAERSGRTILHPTDVEFKPGERVGLVGASGSGKSTLGHVLIDTLRAKGVSVAHVPQSPDEALDPLRTLAFHWREAERVLGLCSDDARRRDLFNALQIEGGDLRKRPWGWSRGMQQRFVIAMALIGTPDVLVMDEPTSALDPVVAAGTMDLLDTCLTDRHTALLLITHDLGLAARRVSRLMVMEAGRIVEDAPTQRLLAAPETTAAKALCAHRNWLQLPC